MSIEAKQIEMMDVAKKGLRCSIGEPMSKIPDDTVEAYRSVLAKSGVPAEDIEKSCTQIAETLHANHVPNARVMRRKLIGVFEDIGLRNHSTEPIALPVEKDIVVLSRSHSS